ncbi:MAG: hypothetical protein ABIN08_07025 [Caldimonas sp.]
MPRRLDPALGQQALVGFTRLGLEHNVEAPQPRVAKRAFGRRVELNDSMRGVQSRRIMAKPQNL